MNLSEINNKLNEIFINSNHRQIVFWYDGDKAFEDEIDNISLNNVELFILDNNNLIYAKYYMEFLKKDTNFLVYAPFEQPIDEENYLADIVHYSELFSADKVSFIAQELNIPPNLNFVVAKYPKFWNADARVNAFKDLNIINYTELNIIKGILAVLTKQMNINFSYILRAVITEELKETNKFIEEFKKYNILDDFWTLVSKEYKYNSSNPLVEEFISFLLVNYTANLFEGNTPKPWTNYLVEDKNNAHIFIENFMTHTHFSDIYDQIAKVFEPKLKITSFKKENIDSYIKCDSFETFDKNIISHYIDLLYTNKVNLGVEFDKLLEDRKLTHFYKKYENYYLLLKYSNLFISLINDFQREYLPESIEDIIDVFAKKWSYIDKYYRKFYFHYDKLNNTEEIEDLRQLIENMYVNSFLNKINPHFTNKLAGKNLNDIKILKQWKFFKNNVSGSISKNKTAVIISDGFRYGCAVELLEELENDPTRQPSLEPMISTIPSYTALGMGALLPNKEIKYDENNNVLVDNKKCRNTIERENILKSYVRNSKAMNFPYFNNLKINELREELKGLDLIYIYHNQIDSAGEEFSSQHDVFNAAQRSIKDLTKIIKKLRDYGYFTKIIITADHGFIYKRDSLNESDKVSVNTVGLDKDKRYILSNEALDITGTANISLNYLNMDLYATVPMGADLFKTPGNGLNYVHGGASLQECIVPVLEVKAERGAIKQRKVELQLISTNNLITNHEVMLTFFQKENISQDVSPLKAHVFFVDEYDEKISNVIQINADKNTNSSEDREFKEKFRLKKITYDKTKDYYLVIEDADKEVEITREKFIINIAFQDGFDFGL